MDDLDEFLNASKKWDAKYRKALIAAIRQVSARPRRRNHPTISKPGTARRIQHGQYLFP